MSDLSIHRPDLGVVYVGDVEGTQIVCVPETQAMGLQALYESSTWGEFRRRAPAFVRDSVESRFWNPDDIPDDDDPLDMLAIPGVADGDWPWPASDMMDWMPAEVQARCGEVISTRLNGEYLHIELERLDELIDALSACGYRVRRDDVMVTTICGG